MLELALTVCDEDGYNAKQSYYLRKAITGYMTIPANAPVVLQRTMRFIKAGEYTPSVHFPPSSWPFSEYEV